jgi:hypothetical protein
MALWTDKDESAGKPQYLTSDEKTSTYGADIAETTATAGIAHAGWVLRTVGTGARTGRTTYETLVAMKSMSTDGDAGIATQTRTITISAQPQSASRANAASVTFSVTASVSPATSSTLAYQWQVNTGSAYADITGATSAAYTKTVATAEDGYLFRAVVSTDGATPVTSDAATLTVTA